ncbi:hypothetical protein BLNAU_3023 [Blattamonas nauphoetae]|uniref:Uncharacterized protein n=1 Tax=Blattamonas nauphoetae TaxID=2049346 RepID=A0ABQ9YDY5_9EUKA|nr:hypothetical protein BLNAU_3023 [Blattamonas nauphoetae]
MHGLVVQIVDKYRPLTHSAFHTMLWDSASSTSTSFLVVHDVLQQYDKLRNLLPIDALFDHARLAFVELGNLPKVNVLVHRGEWLFSDFLTVLQELSQCDSGAPCFSSAMNEITEICQSILNELDTHPSVPPPPPSFPTLDSEDTHLSTQMPSPPSLSLDSENNTVDFETRNSPTEKRRKSCLRILTLIHEIRSRRTDTGETDWDIPPFITSEDSTRTEPVTRDHFDHTIFDSVDQHDIHNLLSECTKISRQTGNLNHLTLTPQYLTKLTLFILSETGFMGESAGEHLKFLLNAVPDPREIVSTVFPLLRNAFHRTNENACDSLLWVVVKELQMNGDTSVLLASWTDADWIAFFSHRWIRLQPLHLLLGILTDILAVTKCYRQSPSTSDLSLVRLFSASNHILPRSDTLITLFSKPDDLGGFEQFEFFCAIVVCFAPQDEPLPSSIFDAILRLNSTDYFSTLIDILITVVDQSKHEIPHFLSSFPVDFVIEKELSRMLVLLDEKSGPELIVLCEFFAPDTIHMFLHPFILRGLGSSLLQYQLNESPASHLQVLSLILFHLCRSSTVEDSIQLFVRFPSDQIVELSIPHILSLDRATRSELFNEQERSLSLALITTLASHSLHTASVDSLHRWFHTFDRLQMNRNRNSDECHSTLWVLMTLCLSQLRLRLPPFTFSAQFGEVFQQLLALLARWSVSGLTESSHKLMKLAHSTEIWFSEGSVSRLEQEASRHQACREVLPDLVSPIPARRNAALVLLSKVCERANCGMVVDLCRFGVVECVIAGVDVSSSLEEYEMGISILGSILRTLAFSESIDEIASFDFSPLLDQFVVIQ